MASKSDADVIGAVTARIDAAIQASKGTEKLIIGILVALFAAGMLLMVVGLFSGGLGFLVTSGLFQLAIVLPITKLVSLRATNIRLQIVPAMIAMADTEGRKTLVFELIQRLIQQVES